MKALDSIWEISAKTFVVTDEEFESLTRYLKFLQLWEMTTS